MRPKIKRIDKYSFEIDKLAKRVGSTEPEFSTEKMIASGLMESRRHVPPFQIRLSGNYENKGFYLGAPDGHIIWEIITDDEGYQVLYPRRRVKKEKEVETSSARLSEEIESAIAIAARRLREFTPREDPPF